MTFNAWIKKYAHLFKTLFVLILSVIVMIQLLAILRSTSISQIEQLLRATSPWRLGLILLIGTLSVIPMIGYDFILQKVLPLNQGKSYILATSWIVNTLNNITGFGGLISVGLRSEFYGKNGRSKELFAQLTKVLFFSLAGLSIYSFFSLLTIYFLHPNRYVQQYWLWLTIGAFYFPVLYLITWLKNRKTAHHPAFQAHLLLTSFLEWSGVFITFLSIGELLNISFSIWEVFPLFIAATVIGILSMIPGAIGSFDVMMILGLYAIGISKETVILWLLVYRIAYYLVPALLGLLLFFHRLFRQFNEKYDQIPRQLSLEIFHKFEVVLLYFSGIMLVLLATIPQAFADFPLLSHVNPFRFQLILRYPFIVLGFALLILARGMAARVKRAYWPTLFCIGLAIIYSSMIHCSWMTIGYFILLFAFVVVSKSELKREQLVYSWEWRTIDGLLFGVLTIAYLLLGTVRLPPLPAHRPHYLDFLIVPSEKIWLSGFIIFGSVTLFLLLILRYLEGPKKQVGQPFHQKAIEFVLTTYGGNSDSELVFLKDKSVFFYPNAVEPTVFLQFSTINNKCVVMGDPSGRRADFTKAIQAFVEETDRWGYQPVFYEAREEMVMILHEFGYDFIKMGEEAMVDLATFTITGKKNRGIRATVNRITKEGFTFEVLHPPYTQETIEDLREISNQWLHGRKERGFSLGFFTDEYLQRNPVAIVKNKHGEIVSFATIIPSYNEDVATIDLMRHHPTKAPTGSMDFLFIQLFDYLKDHHSTFDLGMAPLSNVGTSRKSFVQERVAALVYAFGNRFYSFQGLRDFKEKYASRWVPRYTLYSRDSWIAYVIIALLILDHQPCEEESSLA